MKIYAPVLVGLLVVPGFGCRPDPAVSPEVVSVPTSSQGQVGTQAKPLFLNGVFPIGVFSQPPESFAKWKSRGINTILEVPQGHDPVSWDKAARAAGLFTIRRPMADPKQDIGRKDLLAWSHWDEPDAAGRIAQWTPMFEKTAKEWRAIDPNRRIFINFAGPDLSWFTTQRDAYSTNYASHYPRLLATADWIANDLYPCGGWLNQAHARRRGDISLLGEPIKILKRMTTKPQFAFIEASEIERGNVEGARCPTTAEFRAEIWYAITQGVRGLFYFPAVVGKGGFSFDGAPPEIVAEMTKQNAIIQKIAPLLQTEIDPPGFGAEVPEGISIGWRVSNGKLLVILVNTKASAVNTRIKLNRLEQVSSGVSLSTGATVSLQSGVLNEKFDPHEVQVLMFEYR